MGGTNLSDYSILNGGTVDTYLTNPGGHATLVRCSTANIPSAVAGYAVGCLLQNTTTGNNYVNTGTTSSCTFTLLDAGASFGLPTSATDATTTTTTSFQLTTSAITTGNSENVTAAAITTGAAYKATLGTSLTTGGAFNASLGAATTGYGFTSTTTGVYTGAGLLQLTASSATTGAIASIVTTSSKALIIGQAAATPVFQVDSSTASQIAGLKVTGAATGGTVAIATIDSGADASLTINGKGAGTIGIGTVSTGAVTITPATTVTGLLTLTGGLTSAANAILKSGTAVPATAGAVAAGAPITMYSGNITIELTSDVPTHSRNKGSICINTGGSSTSTRLYVNNGTTTWVAITTAS